MDWGDKEDWLIKASLNSGAPLPKVIQNKPILDYELFVYWEFFWILSRSRQYGYGILQPISLSELKALLDLYEIKDDVELFICFIQYLDGIYLEKMNKKKQ